MTTFLEAAGGDDIANLNENAPLSAVTRQMKELTGASRPEGR